jgi:hypothetical protein
LLFKNIYQYLFSNLEDTWAFKICRYLFIGVTLILFAWFLYFSFCTIVMPYQIEYREGAAPVMTQILLKGGNPFSLEYQPLGMNNYGIGYSLLVLPFARLFGNTLMIHRSVSFFFLLTSLLLIAQTIWLLKKDLLLSILGGIFIVVALAGRDGLGAFPATMGAFLFLSTILLPFIYSFRNSSLIVSALLAVTAYYTKPYFLIGFGVVAVYAFVFISKRKGILYSLFFLSAFGVSFLGVNYVFKLYFIDTFISNLSNATRSPEHLLRQLIEMGIEFYPSILLGGMLLFFNLPIFSSTKIFQKNPSSSSGFLQLDEPLFTQPMNYFAFTFIFCFYAFVSFLGLHLGSYMAYAYQLVLPPFILWLFQMLNSKNRFSIIAFCLLLGNIFMFENTLLNPAFLHQSDSAAWRNLYNYVKKSQHVANSPAIVSMLIDAGVMPVDSGQTEYYYIIQPYQDNFLISPDYETISMNGITYQNSLRDEIRNHKFDKVFTTQGYLNLIPPDLISQYYMQVDTITVDMPQTYETWVIGVWEPKAN